MHYPQKCLVLVLRWVRLHERHRSFFLFISNKCFIHSTATINKDYRFRAAKRDTPSGPFKAIDVSAYWCKYVKVPPTKQQPKGGLFNGNFVDVSNVQQGAFCVWIPGPWVLCICGQCGRIMAVRSLHDHWEKAHCDKYNVIGLKNVVAYHNNYLMDPLNAGRPAPEVVDFGEEEEQRPDSAEAHAKPATWKQVLYHSYKTHNTPTKELYDFLVQNEDVHVDAEEIIQADSVENGRLLDWTVAQLSGLKEKLKKKVTVIPTSPKKKTKEAETMGEDNDNNTKKKSSESNPFIAFLQEKFSKEELRATPKKMILTMMDELHKRFPANKKLEVHQYLDMYCEK